MVNDREHEGSASARTTAEQFEVAVAVAACNTPSWEKRRLGVRSLGDLMHDPLVFARAVAALDDEDLGVVDVATELLAVRGGDAGMRELARAYALSEDCSNTIGDRLLNLTSDPTVRVLERLTILRAESSSADVRRGAGELLDWLPAGHRAPPTASAALIAELTSPEWAVRRDAIVALAVHVSLPQVFPRIVDALDDKNLAVVEVAVEALFLHGGDAALREIAASYATTKDNGVYSIEARLVALSIDAGAPVLSRLTALAVEASSGPARDGAIDLMARVPPDSHD